MFRGTVALAFIFTLWLGLGLDTVAQETKQETSQEQTKQETKSQKLQALRKALRGDSDGKASPKPRHPPAPSENVDMRLRALDELKQGESSYSADTAPSVAVVRTQSILAKDPVTYKGLQLGLTIQPYSPAGRVRLVSLGERDLSTAEDTWMPGIEARMLPWNSRLLGEHGVGIRLGAAYSRQNLDLYAPSGIKIGDTRLHALASYAYLSQEWRGPSSLRWSVNADLGILRFDSLLTSSSRLGEASDNIWLGALRVGPAYRAGNFSFQLSYERRERLSEGWGRFAENGVMLGVLYGLR